MKNKTNKFLYINVVTYNKEDKNKNTVYSLSYYPDATVIYNEELFNPWYKKQIEDLKVWLKETFASYKISKDKKTLFLVSRTGQHFVGKLGCSWLDDTV